MASPRERYMREIAKQWAYLVTWLPSRTVRLGQTGRFDGLEVQIDADISDVGFALAASHDQSTTNLEYNTGRAVTFDFTAGASIATGESAELQIGFKKDNAIVMHLHEAVESTEWTIWTSSRQRFENWTAARNGPRLRPL
jgi:hypothetical protein